ncbi:MAG: DUF1501 domain-containing protein [Stagnimonas sp.]|nr:DUF1501 domain-containing protein [Stagnimonas sp.]
MSILHRALNRRDMLRLGTQTAASASMMATLGSLQTAMAASDTTGYKALVCVFLAGGNDAYNWLVPRSDAAYKEYADSRKNLALAKADLLAITPTNTGSALYGLHPSCPEIQTLFNTGKAAFVVNTGPLVQPTTLAQYKAESVPLPYQLFSHSDQQALTQTSIANSTARYGWGGRVADLLNAQGLRQSLAMNVSISGNNIFQGGRDTVLYNIGTDSAPEMNIYQDGYYHDGKRRELFLKLLALSGNEPSLLQKEYAGTLTRSYQTAETVNAALASVPALTTSFGSDYLSRQLKMAARMVRARDALGVKRQVFFVQIGGWDFHDTLLVDQAKKLGELSKALKSFQDALAEISAENMVTTFVASEFGRTLTSNGDGTDHGWGGHTLVLGGGVQGKKLYGTFPSLAVGGASDTGRGATLPTTSTDQVAATLSSWFGVSNSDLDTVFPNLRNFSERNLGFV